MRRLHRFRPLAGLVLTLSSVVWLGCRDPQPGGTDAGSEAPGADVTDADTRPDTAADSGPDVDDGAADTVASETGDTGTAWDTAGYPEDCLEGLSGGRAAACAADNFWRAFQVDFSDRSGVYDLMTGVIDALEAGDKSVDDATLARLYFRRGQLGLALVIEQEAVSKITQLSGDFDRAMELKPDYDIVPPWKDAVEIAKASLRNNPETLEALKDRVWKHVERAPLENTLSISGTTIGLPLETGYPEKTIQLLDEWECTGEPWCTENTREAPFARPGLNYHFAESYARMGQRQEAKKYLERTLDAPGADRWPFRPLAEDALRDLDGFVGTYEELGPDGSAFRKIYANKEYGCMFCHSPADAVPEAVRTNLLEE